MRQATLETIAEPDLVQRGDSGELLAIRRYESTPMTTKYLVAPYREGFVVRMDASEKEVVGLTVVGLRSRLLKNLPPYRRGP